LYHNQTSSLYLLATPDQVLFVFLFSLQSALGVSINLPTNVTSCHCEFSVWGSGLFAISKAITTTTTITMDEGSSLINWDGQKKSKLPKVVVGLSIFFVVVIIGLSVGAYFLLDSRVAHFQDQVHLPFSFSP